MRLRPEGLWSKSGPKGHKTKPVESSTEDCSVGPLSRAPVEPPGSPCVTFCLVVVSLRGPGQSPVLPFACCVGSLRSVGRCSRGSCWCRFRVHGAQWLVCRGCAVCGGMHRLRVSWRIGGCAGCCGGCLTVFAVHTPPSSASLRLHVREAQVPCSSTRCPGRPPHTPPPPQVPRSF